MKINQKQLEQASLVQAMISLLPVGRQTIVACAGRNAAQAIAQGGLTIGEQETAIAIANLFLQFCNEDENNQKLSALMEQALSSESTSVNTRLN